MDFTATIPQSASGILFKRILIALMADIHNRRHNRRLSMLKAWRLNNLEKRQKQCRESMRRYPERNNANHKKWRAINTEYLADKERKRYCSNRTASIATSKAYYLKHKDRLTVLKKRRDTKNKDRIAAYAKTKRLNRTEQKKEEENTKSRIYAKLRKQRDPAYRIICSFRSRISRYVKKPVKKFGMKELLGCTREQLLNHFESQFNSGMNWTNYGIGDGRWVIDHKRPIASFNHLDAEHQKQCWHFTNLQPMWWRENIIKSDRILEASGA